MVDAVIDFRFGLFGLLLILREGGRAVSGLVGVVLRLFLDVVVDGLTVVDFVVVVDVGVEIEGFLPNKNLNGLKNCWISLFPV